MVGRVLWGGVAWVITAWGSAGTRPCGGLASIWLVLLLLLLLQPLLTRDTRPTEPIASPHMGAKNWENNPDPQNHPNSTRACIRGVMERDRMVQCGRAHGQGVPAWRGRSTQRPAKGWRKEDPRRDRDARGLRSRHAPPPSVSDLNPPGGAGGARGFGCACPSPFWTWE